MNLANKTMRERFGLDRVQHWRGRGVLRLREGDVGRQREVFRLDKWGRWHVAWRTCRRSVDGMEGAESQVASVQGV